MSSVDFDFARYVAFRRGVGAQRARDGAAYAFGGERKVRRALVSARPVAIAIEATTRLWKNVAKTELLDTAIKATDTQFPRVYAAVKQGSARLGVRTPPVYVAPASSKLSSQVLGTNDDPYIVINAELVERCNDLELLALIGHELGHLQNDQVVYATSLYYLTNSAMMFVRWVVQPAIMTLQAWSRRAEITCDRAALLCTQDLNATIHAMVKMSLGFDKDADFDIEAYLASMPTSKGGVGRYAELFRSHPYLPKRIAALKLFAESSFYARVTGDKREDALSAEDLDAQVGEIVSVF